MRMDKGQQTDGPIISAFSSGGFKVDDGVYHALLITPVRADGWTPESIASDLVPAFKPSFEPLRRSSEVFAWDPI